MRVRAIKWRMRSESERFHTSFCKQPILILGERFECQHACWDPKDGELYLSRVNPGETLVDARGDTDVQIVCTTWL